MLLRDCGIGKGERVVIWGENGADWIAAFFGCIQLGVLPVPLDAAGSAAFARRVIDDVSPKLIVADGEKLRCDSWSADTLTLGDLADSLPQEELWYTPALAPDDPLQIIFTSGTTGEPKGVVHTHGNVLASLRPIEREMQKYLRYERPFHPIRFLHTLPLSHVFGQFMGLWIPPLLGAEVHFETRLVAGELASLIRREKISVLASVPRVLELMQSYVAGNDPSLPHRIEQASRAPAWQRWWRFRDVHRLFGLKFWAFICGGAALSPEGERFWNALGFVVVQGYGMTETTALVSLNHPFRPAAGTIGQVLPGREVKLSGEGEVMVRGETISTSAWQNGKMQELGDEWLPTGDLAEFDQAGNLRFRGRKKDIIVTSAGLNIHPQDLEAALSSQPNVKAASVVETAGSSGPEPLAVLVLEANADAQTAVDAANRQLAEFQHVRHWLVWPEPDLPRTSTGKVLRREIARRIESGEIERQDAAQSQQSLNLDSLGRVQLQAELESKYGVAIDDAAIAQVKTQADVQQLTRVSTPALGRVPAKQPRHIYPRWTLSRWQNALRGVFLDTIAMPILKFLGRPRLRRTIAALPDSPMLIVANHVTSYDAAFVLFGLPSRARQRVAIAMSAEMLYEMRTGRNQGHWFLNLVSPIAYFLITALFNVYPLPQFSGFRESFSYAGEAMDRGYSVLVFPEGRRSDDGTPQPFKSGAGLLWRELGSPALPMYLGGLGELKLQRKGWFRSGRLTIDVGPILSLDRASSPEQLTKDLQQAVFGLAGGISDVPALPNKQ